MASWWSSDRIEATATPEYISRKLPAKKQSALHQPLAFGQGLTDDTYLDWILSRSRKLFLILNDVGCAEHIFDAVDKSFDDDDLPFDEDAIKELKLGNGALDKKFARRQHAYNVQELPEGSHVDYAEDDIVPIDPVPKVKGMPLASSLDRVTMGRKSFSRRRLSLGEESGIERVHFVLHFKSLERLKHPHLVNVWATYIFQEQGYILLNPYCELNLKSFLEDPPKGFKNLPKPEQREILFRWIYCLSSALASLHENGYAHQAIRPANIYIDSNYNIILGEYAALGALDDKEPAYEKDAYENAAPEQWQRRATLQETNPLRSTLQGGGRTGRRIKAQKRWSQDSSLSPPPLSANSSLDSNKRSSTFTANTIPSSSSRSSQLPAPSITPTTLTTSSSSSSSQPTNSCRPSHTIISTVSYRQPSAARTLYDQSPLFPSDIFSLSTIILQVLSLVASISCQSSKLSPSSLRSHLGKHNRTAGRGGAPADSSFHANLRQVSIWLDLLAQAAEKPSRKLPRLRRSSAKSRSSDGSGDEAEAWRWRGALGCLVDLIRPGLAKIPDERFSAVGCAIGTKKIFDRWGFTPGSCCIPSSMKGSGSMSVITAIRVPPRTSSSGASSSTGSGPRRERRLAPQEYDIAYETSEEDYETGDEQEPAEPVYELESPVPYELDSRNTSRQSGPGRESIGRDGESVMIALDGYDWPRPVSVSRRQQGQTMESITERFVDGGTQGRGLWPPRHASQMAVG